MEKLYTTDEAREYLKVSYTTIQRYVSSGRLKSEKVGRRYRIYESDLKEFIKSGNKKGSRRGGQTNE